MADQDKKPSDAGVLSRLAGRGEDALTRLMDELGRNSRVTDALARTMAAKGKVDETTRKTLGTVGLAAAGEIRDLSRRLETLEKRLATLESSGGGAGGRGQAGRKPATTTKTSGGTAKSGTGSRAGATTRSRSSAASSGSSRPQRKPESSGPSGSSGGSSS